MRKYRRHEKLEYILLVDGEVAAVTLFERTKSGWDILDAERLPDVIELPKIKCQLALADIYANTGIEELPQSDLANQV